MGQDKQNFNKFFEPRYSEWKGICSRDDLTGEWGNCIFRNTI